MGRWPAVIGMVAACGATPTNRAATTSTAAAPSVGASKPGGPVTFGTEPRWQPLGKTPFLAERIRMTTPEERGTIACAISRDRRVACWGDRVGPTDPNVELRANAATPHLLAGVDDVIDIAVSDDLICVARASSPSGCFPRWHDPAPVFSGPVTELGAKVDGICARYADGRIACTKSKATALVPIAGLTGATSLSCIEKTCCAVAGDGRTMCFGESMSQHGIDDSTDAVPLPDTPKASAIALGYPGACVLKADRSVACWSSAKALTGTRGVRAVRTFQHGVCLLLDRGGIQCSKYEQIVGMPESRSPPAPDAVDVEGRCLVHRTGAVSCWGTNESGELGDGNPLFVATPRRVTGLDDVVDLRMAQDGTCAIKRDKSIACWGHEAPEDPAPSIGISREEPLPSLDTTELPGKIVSFAVDSYRDTCVLDSAGRVRCYWHGQDDWLRLGAPARVAELEPMYGGFCARFVDGTVGTFEFDGDQADAEEIAALPRAKLARVPGIKGAIRITGGEYACYAMTKDGRAVTFSRSGYEARRTEALSGVTALATFDSHGCAVAKHRVWCWGSENRYGQIGDGVVGDWEHAATARQVQATFNATAVAVGPESSCAIDDTRHVWCWGDDSEGHLGSKRPLASKSLSRVVGLGP